MEVSKPLILHIEVGSSHATCHNRLNILIETVSIQSANYTEYEDIQLQLHLKHRILHTNSCKAKYKLNIETQVTVVSISICIYIYTICWKKLMDH